MKVKRYVVDSLPIAVEEIKKDLGKDAIILHSKKIKVGGFLGFFGKEKMEVIAAIDPKPVPSSKPVEPRPQQNSPSSLVQTQITANKGEQGKEEKIKNDSDLVMKEVQDLKQVILKMLIDGNKNDDKLAGSLKEFYDRLIKQGVDHDLANHLITNVLQKIDKNNNEQEIASTLKKEIVHVFEHKGLQKEIRPDTKIVHFVGPTGVGKTTTIAKLAAESVLKEKKKIAFITSDTYRIAAVEQLKTYAEIFNAPLEVVHSPEDTEKAIQRFKEFDLIVMDTAGRNYLNELYINDLNKILLNGIPSETFLVLSLNQKYEDIVAIFEQFKKVRIDKLLFTKYDETSTYGSIFNVLSKFPYQTSFITNGQNVPDDIEIFNEEKMAKALLGV